MPTLSSRRRHLLTTTGKLAGAVALAGALVAGIVLPFVGGAGVAADKAASRFLNTSCDLVISPAQQTSTVYASDGKTVIATLYAQNRRDVALSQIPQSVQDALISTEDKRFYSHHGVDLHGLVRAALANTDGSGDTQGGSTLTMQYVKQVRYYQATNDAQRQAAIQQDLNRKLQDAQCAIGLEKEYSKTAILDDYLNIAFFGENSYGIQVAAQTYFGVPAAKLTVPQGAMLVGLVQSPSELDPFVNPQAARERRNQVLQNMVANNELSAADAARYATSPLGLASSKAPVTGQGCTNAATSVKNVGFFCDYVLNWLETTGGLKQQTLETGGLKIVTSLDASLQNSGQAAIWNSGLDPNSPTALVMPSVDPRTGAVQTMITSRRYGVGAGQTTVPLFTDGYAGSGSTYKYFTTLAALTLGVQPSFTLTTGSNAYTVKNCPTDANTTPYQTHNAGSYRPTLPLSSALPESVNTYFVGMEDQLFGCDLTPIVQTALGLGMNTLNAPDHAGSTETIAQATIAEHRTGFTLGFSPTSALELSAAYGAVANDGVFCPANPILQVTGPAGGPVSYTKPACSRQFDTQVARTMVAMMTADTSSSLGTAGRYFGSWYGNGGSLVASKTGTDNDDASGPDGGNGNSALWFAGITPTLVSAAALVNPTSPKATLVGLPDTVSRNTSDVFGAYASTFWLDAYGPRLAQQEWNWADPADVTDPVDVPDLAGQSTAAATSTLSGLGLGVTVAATICGSGEAAGTVGYYEPHIATAGSKVTLCLSNGTAPDGSGQYGSGQYGSGQYGGTGSGGTDSGNGTTGGTGSGTPSGGGSAPPSSLPSRHPG
ncbi:MAG: transglycosylase domain-containing protein [Jatrophihabitans sp.]